MRRGNRQAIERAEREPLLMVLRQLWSRLGENCQCDAMMGERKIELEEWPAPWRCGQAGQNPHAAPTFARLLQEHAVSPPHQGVRFRQVNCSRPPFLGRQNRRALGAAKGANRTFDTTRLTRQTDHRAKIHQRGVVFAHAASWEERGRSLPEMSATDRGINRYFPVR